MAFTAISLASLLSLLAVTDVTASTGSVTSATARTSDFTAAGGQSVVVQEGVAEDWVARANFSDEISDNGWAYLEVETRPTASDQEQAYLAGFLEGAATHELIYNHWRNIVDGYCEVHGQDYCSDLRQFLKTNRDYMDNMIDEFGSSDPYWHQVSLILQQLQGIADGYRNASSNPLTDEDIYWMNLAGDLPDLEQALKSNQSHNVIPNSDHCSVLIKVLPGNSDLYTSHVSWFGPETMLRIQKKYIFPFKTLNSSVETVPGDAILFSSYPAFIHSYDDFYLVSSGLVTLETTNVNFNDALWEEVKPDEQVLEFIRVMVSNRLASDGKTWTETFGGYNSGTYNNQYMIVNYNNFSPKQSIGPDTLWVLEQMPGLIVAHDQSSVLHSRGYWTSYNAPYYEEIFVASGRQQMVEEYGDYYSYDNTSRALIFKRNQSDVMDVDSMVKLMRYNDFKNDPLSACDCDPPHSADLSISARDDLNSIDGTYPFADLGPRPILGTDMKLTTYAMFKDFEMLAISGPTYDQQPVFQWSTSIFANNTPHYGHPDRFEFPPVQREWMW